MGGSPIIALKVLLGLQKDGGSASCNLLIANSREYNKCNERKNTDRKSHNPKPKTVKHIDTQAETLRKQALAEAYRKLKEAINSKDKKRIKYAQDELHKVKSGTRTENNGVNNPPPAENEIPTFIIPINQNITKSNSENFDLLMKEVDAKPMPVVESSGTNGNNLNTLN